MLQNELRPLLLITMALWAVGCSAPAPEGQTLDLNTEVASFCLFHPDDLQHRRASPMLWRISEFALAPELAAGNLVAFSTGADGGFRIRLTEGDLSARENKYDSCSWDFRYKVRHGRVLIDNGDFIPYDRSSPLDDLEPTVASSPDPIPANQWFKLPNGDYKVTVHAIDWEREPGAVDGRDKATKAALPGYVIQFKKVDRLDSIKAATSEPTLEPGPSAKPRFSPNSVDESFEDIAIGPLPESCPAVIAPELLLVPGFLTSPLMISDQEFTRLQPRDLESGPAFSRVVLLNTDRTPCLGLLSTVASASGVDGGEWKVAFQPDRLVNVVEFATDKDGIKGRLARFHRPKSDVSEAELAAIKAAFASYAKVNRAYRKVVKHPDYEAERVMAMRSPASISTILLHHFIMPSATRVKLLPLSDADRIKELQALLSASDGA